MNKGYLLVYVQIRTGYFMNTLKHIFIMPTVHRKIYELQTLGPKFLD